MTTSTNPVVNRPHASTTRILLMGLLGGLLAAVGNLIVHFAAEGLFNIGLVVPLGESGTQLGGSLIPLSPLRTALTSFIPGVGAGVLLYLLTRASSEPMQIFLGLGFSVLLFSFTLPLGLATIPPDVRVVLVIMHVVAALAILGIIWRYWRGG